MSALGLLIIAVTLLVSVGVYVVSGGHVMIIALPLMIGVPLAGLFGRRR